MEIDMARRAVEEKAEQLALTSKYKSEFLANMSHELRTPLNSLLILSKLLADNPQGNLNEKQTEFARTIHSAGSDLLSLINDILDLSKIESGTVSIELGDMAMSTLRQHMERTFRQLAADKGLDFQVEFDGRLPGTIRTDEKRLQQVVLNLLSNAFKFTAQGSVTLSVREVYSGWSTNHPVLRSAIGRLRSRSPIPASAFPRQAEADLRGRSSRPTAPPAANMAAPASAFRSAARSRACSAASCRSAPSRARLDLHPVRAAPGAAQQHASARPRHAGPLREWRAPTCRSWRRRSRWSMIAISSATIRS
jgi:hypothetical protein